MRNVVPIDEHTQLPSAFDPKTAKLDKSKAEAIIKVARDTKDWELLDDASEWLLDHLTALVGWWRVNVTPAKGGDRRSDQKRINAFLMSDAEELLGFKQQQISRIGKGLKDRDRYKLIIKGGAYKKAMMEADGREQFLVERGENEWHSPTEVVEAARSIMGGIDLDPASCEKANEIIQAITFYDAKTDGLAQPWHGRVWLNPPYGYLAPKFIEKFCDEFSNGSIQQGCLLLGSHHMTSKWFYLVAALDPVLCIFNGRLRFNNTAECPTHGSVLLGAGVGRSKFRDELAATGTIWVQLEA